MTVSTLFERLGGSDSVRATVNEFHERLQGDDELRPFFKYDPKLARFAKMHQLQILRLIFSTDRDIPAFIADKHRHLFSQTGLCEHHFDRMSGHLLDSLYALGYDANLINEAKAKILPLRAVFQSESYIHNPTRKAPLLQRLGGSAAVEVAVEKLYERLLEDPYLAFFLCRHPHEPSSSASSGVYEDRLYGHPQGL